MKNEMISINPLELNENAINLIGKEWMLISAGTPDKLNTMTASWGGLGMLWNRPVVFIFIRPQRYTYEFVEQNDYFTCCFFDKKYNDALHYCGSHSGRDVNKIEETGLRPVKSPSGSIFFEEARISLECRKIAFQDINPDGFLQESIAKNYPGHDYHRMYIGEITFCGIK
ncbi:MAG: flavin reductase family protein [Lentimicrobiaceae bacterium]|nr:flavin reductase family protein [Lentimicrobiaceae bacterium]MCB9023233.1 flavin reductase family protein [Lentimicrobiaceae bacterium]MCO5266491.1 flavin reductase family protein [Lentimicrobium sp.]